MRTPALCERSTHTNVCTRLHKCVCLCALRPLHLLSLEHSSCLSGNTRVRVCVCCSVLPPSQAPLSMRFPGKDTGVGCHSPLQGILPTQGSSPGPLLCRKILYHLSHLGSPIIMYIHYMYVYMCVCIYTIFLATPFGTWELSS